MIWLSIMISTYINVICLNELSSKLQSMSQCSQQDITGVKCGCKSIRSISWRHGKHGKHLFPLRLPRWMRPCHGAHWINLRRTLGMEQWRRHRWMTHKTHIDTLDTGHLMSSVKSSQIFVNCCHLTVAVLTKRKVCLKLRSGVFFPC